MIIRFSLNKRDVSEILKDHIKSTYPQITQEPVVDLVWGYDDVTITIDLRPAEDVEETDQE